MGKFLILSVADHEEHILNKIMEPSAKGGIAVGSKRLWTVPCGSGKPACGPVHPKGQ